MVSDKLKEIIFKKLYMDLRDVEIIPYEDSIYFINRKEKYWYLELEKNGTLYWRHSFFLDFFSLFSMECSEYVGLISEWVEEVLNHKVSATFKISAKRNTLVEEVLNHKVSEASPVFPDEFQVVEEVLNNKVLSSLPLTASTPGNMDEILNGGDV